MNKKTNIWMPYAQMQTAPQPLNIIRTDGSFLYDTDGRRYIDGIASWWTACHGYQHPYIMKAIRDQSQTLSHVMMGGIVHPQATRLAQRLTDLMPGNLDYVMFSESGSVAVEIALKMAWQYWQHQDEPQRQQFISLQNGYHGDTFLTMALCDPETGMHRFMQDHLSQDHLPRHHLSQGHLPQHHCIALPNDVDGWIALDLWLSEHAPFIAGIIIEPLVQGAAGMQMHTPQQLKTLCELCRKYHILIIIDEIFTGFYRTGSLLACQQANIIPAGSLLACEQENIIPDLLCLSKALSGGVLPIAATLASTKIYEAFLSNDPHKAFMHGSTFMGNALACAAANASLDLFELDNYAEKAKTIEFHLNQALMPLKEISQVKDVRVKGAIGAITLNNATVPDMNALQQRCLDAGVWLRPINNVIYTTPALTIEIEHLEFITETIEKQISKMNHSTKAINIDKSQKRKEK